MKTFIVALVVFSVLLTLIILNALFVNRAMDKFRSDILALPACDEIALSDVVAAWESYYTLLSLSVSRNEMRDMDVWLAEMRVAAKRDDALQFETARAKALDSIDDIRRLERIALSNVL